MHAEDRRAFDTILAEIFGAIDKPLTEASKEGFWKGLSRMSIVEFSRCRDALFSELEAGERPRNFSVANVWALKGKLRAAAPEPRPADDWQGDEWDVRANLRLLSAILRHGYNRRRAYTPEQTRAMVAMKHHWAQLMRTAQNADITEQDECWSACMREASDMTRAAA